MIIKNELIVNGLRLAYCIGDDIPGNFECREISIRDKVYRVLKSGSSMSLNGKMTALLQIDLNDTDEMPTGEFKVLQ